MSRLSCFKAYDVRGRVGEDLTEDLAHRLGRAFARVLDPGRVVLGRDIRDSSPMLQDALARGLMDEGVEVFDIGLCGTEEVYFATDHYGAGGGMMVTASHNPIGDNGVKMVRQGARPISRQSGLAEIEALVAGGDAPLGRASGGGSQAQVDPRAAYVEKVLSFVNAAALDGRRIVVNAGNGAAGPTFDAIADGLAARGSRPEFTRLHHDPNPLFPNGIPNPLLPENQPVTGEATREAGAEMGVAWDGDFDRCFLFDAEGGFVDGEYVVGLLAEAILAREPGGAIVHDPRVMWNTHAVVARAGGRAVVSRTGHALMKEKMREVDAVYGGEMSAHHYFRDFMYCDSGMVPWLLIAQLLGETGQSLSDMLARMRAAHPSSGEINFRLSDAEAAVAAIESEFAQGAEIDRLDGLSAAFGEWRFNLRRSNTEPLVRLNVETRGNRELLDEKVGAISARLQDFA